MPSTRWPAARSSPDVLFVLHDAGETFALNGTIRQLLAQRVGVTVLPLGQPATNVVSCAGPYAGCEALPSLTLAQLGVSATIVDGTHGRGQLLAEQDLQKIQRALAPRVVVTGMSYAMQLQIGRLMKTAREARFAAFYDGLRVIGSDSDISPRLQQRFAQAADELWIASAKLWPFAEGWGHNYRVVGQPTLQDWQALGSRTSELRAVRRRLYGEEALRTGAPALCWFGGYGPGYERALRTWCQAVKKLSSSSMPLRFSLASHPVGAAGELDRQVMRDEGVEGLVALVPRGLPGKVAALASNLTASQGSTGGVQSVFAGKPAVFLDPEHAFANRGNLGVLLGLIPNLHSLSSVLETVRDVAVSDWSVDTSKLDAASVPCDSILATTNATLALLQLPRVSTQRQ